MAGDLQPSFLDIAFLLAPTLWAGLLLGVSFIATPAKFHALSLTRPAALDVGRATFAVWNNVEWFVLAVLVSMVVLTRADLFAAAAVGALVVLLMIQSLMLLPLLNDRVVTIIAGGRPPPSSDHLIYVAVDAIKLLILAAIVWKQGERIAPLFAYLR
jgi:hypothetical protein